MKLHGTGRVWMVGLLATGLLLALSPAAVQAVCTVPDGANGALSGTLLEVMESPPAHAAPGGPTLPGAFPPGIGRQLSAFVARLAQATEVGRLEGCGSLTDLTGDWEFHAQSRIPVTDGLLGTGTIKGVFQGDTDSNGVVAAKFTGLLQFINACGGSPPGPCPFAFTGGTWNTVGKARRAGQFAGTALVPVGPSGELACTLASGGCFYIIPTITGGVVTGFTVVPLDPATEYSKQFKTGLAKFLLMLTEP